MNVTLGCPAISIS